MTSPVTDTSAAAPGAAADAKKELLVVDNIELYYDHIYAVRGVSLYLHEGETIALIGANGAGKSSILRAITNLRRIDSGAIYYNGDRIDGTAAEAVVRAGIVMVPEGRRVFPYMSVRDNLLMGAFTRDDKEGISTDLDKIMHKFPRLRERWLQSANTMSGGEQQMLVIGRALMARPRLLLLDEPSLGIAPQLVQQIARSIVEINRDDKVSVILVEQNSRMAMKISHRTYALVTGTVGISGKSADLLNDDRIRQLYLGGEVE